MSANKIKDILRKERESHNLTQEELAKKINISRAAYAKYETGENTPPLPTIIQIANLYNLSLDYLSGRYTIKKGD